jgi:hypothetical protein
MFWCKWCEHLSKCLRWGYNSNLKPACSFLNMDTLYGTNVTNLAVHTLLWFAYGGMPRRLV